MYIMFMYVLGPCFKKECVQVSTFPLIFPVSFQLTDRDFFFFCVHFCVINSNNPPKDIAFVHYVISL